MRERGAEEKRRGRKEEREVRGREGRKGEGPAPAILWPRAATGTFAERRRRRVAELV